MSKQAIIIASGGVDSITLAYAMAAEGYQLTFLTFDYGQKHRKEIEAARYFAGALGVEQIIFDLMDLGTNLNNNALTCETNVPSGEYNVTNMAQTVVPARNAIMLSIACGIAVDRRIGTIAAGMHGGDHFIYPDCRPNFIIEIQQALRSATASKIKLYTPYILKDKTHIIKQGAFLGVPYAETWSCYNGAEIHCGRCGTCLDRRAAFRQANTFDPTIYKCEETT